jgi:hypothetical protein
LGAQQSLDLHCRPAGGGPQNLHRYAAGLVLGLLTAAALVLLARRWAGALCYPLPPALLLGVAVVAAAAAAAIRLAWLSPPPADSLPGIDRGVMLLTSLALASLGAGLCVPGTSAAGVFFLWTLLGAEESWAWGWRLRRGPWTPSSERHARRPGPAYGGAPRLARSNLNHRAAPAFDAEDMPLPKGVTQQLTRSQAADGTEELSGWMRIAFLAGQRTGSLHVAFCPPFPAAPELAVEQLEGPETRIKTAQLMPYGARLDLKLAVAAEEPSSVLLQFSARAKPSF